MVRHGSEWSRVVVLALALVIGGSLLPQTQPASAAPDTWHTIRLDGAARGKASCGEVAYAAATGVVTFSCKVADLKADRYWVLVVPTYWDGSHWRVFPGFGGRSCTNKSGAGAVLTCTHASVLETSDPTIPVRVRVGLVDRVSGAVRKATVWDDTDIVH